MVSIRECDFLIIGAGTAGCVLAERLTRDAAVRVIVVEAGPNPSSPMVSMPAGFAKLFRSKLDWNYESEPVTQAAGRRIFIPRGRMLGGSSNLNAQVHQWAHPSDFESWSRHGVTGWSWEEMAPIYRSQEAFAGHDAGGLRGAHGAQCVAANAWANPASHAFVSAARAAGLGDRPDYNGGDSEGAYLAQIAHCAGRRWSAHDGWLKPAMARRNLTVLADAEAHHITFEGRRAAGARVRSGRQALDLRARGGVILASGAIGSPLMLMRSGIGPAEQITRAGVAVRKHAPEVGANLHDHPMCAIAVATSRKDTFKSAESVHNILRYLVRREGPLASNVAEAIAFARSRPGLKAPDIEILFAPLHWNAQALEPPAYHGFTIGAALLQPVSRGRVSLGDSAAGRPRIDYNLFSDANGDDKATLLGALRLARRICETAPLSGMITGEPEPLAWKGSDDELFSSACRTLQTVYHPAGTCRMGNDAEAVVSCRGAVHGFDGLWVADASIFPAPVSGHPNATVMAVGERIAQFVKQDVALLAA